MKILTRTAAAVLAAVTAAAVWAVPAAAAASVQGISSTSCIADNANILSRDTETYITNISVALQENCSGAQIGVYTTDYVGNNTMEGYAYEVFQAWGLGSADQDNGMVLLMATGDDNYWATPGEGLESAFSGNVLSDLLYDNLEASWAKQDYDTGARKTVLAMAERICDVYGVSLDMDAIGSGLADSSGRIVENTQSRSNGGAVLTLVLLTIIIAVIVIAIAIVINLVAGQLPEKVRNIDISSNNLYDISSVSTKMLKKLDKKVDLKVIAEQDSVDTRIKTFVKKYAALSGKVKVEWVDSVLHPSILQKYNTDGNVIIVSCDATGKSTTISFSDIIQSDYYSYYTTGSASESSFDGEGQLTSAINYVTSEETSKIYRTSGHGEATFSSSVSDLLTKNNLETEEINLSMNPEIPDDCDLLFLYAPTSDITDDEKTIIEKYLSDGGKVYLILGDTTSDTPNLDGIMSDYGLKKVSGYIADTQRCYQGNYYAIFPQLSLSGDLGSGISNQMVLLLNSFGMGKTDTDNDNLTVTPFMQTSDSGYAVTENDQTQGQYILGAVSTNAISADSSDSDSEDEDDESDATDTDTKTARLTVLASASMISSDITDQLTTLDNLTLFVNSVTENFDNVNNVAIEAKSLSTETNTPMHAGAFSILVIFIIPLAILILGFVIWMRRRKA